jgi:outer membrane cobalamin receptor
MKSSSITRAGIPVCIHSGIYSSQLIASYQRSKTTTTAATLAAIMMARRWMDEQRNLQWGNNVIVGHGSVSAASTGNSSADLQRIRPYRIPTSVIPPVFI